MNSRVDADVDEDDVELSGQDDVVEVPEGDRDATFDGDTGQLRVPTRRVLVQLLLGPFIDRRRHPVLWEDLLQDERVIRSRLHELFLNLILDRDAGVAFTRQVVSDEVRVPVILRRANLTFLESALLLLLRQRLAQAAAQDERAAIDRQDILEHLRVYERAANTDQVRFERQMENALEKGKRLGLLQAVRGNDERFEISPTLQLLFPAAEIEELATTYQHLRGASADDTQQSDERA